MRPSAANRPRLMACVGRLAMLCVGWLVVPGCAMFESKLPSILEPDPEYQTPHQVIPVWTDTVLHQTGVRGKRGCGGRFMFYAGEVKESVRVDGSVVVYVWDDTLGTDQRKPDRKYAFEADMLQKHYSKSNVGHSYSFFLPWDDAGGERKELTVVARFIGRDGADVTSAPSKVILPGPVAMPERPTSGEAAADGRETDDLSTGIRQVSWKDNKALNSRQRQTLKSSEIPLTQGFVERNQPAGGYDAEDLFSDPAAEGGARPAATETDGGEASDADEAPLTISEGPSAQRAARLLQSRFRARRERAAQRYASHAENQQSPPPLPPELSSTP